MKVDFEFVQVKVEEVLELVWVQVDLVQVRVLELVWVHISELALPAIEKNDSISIASNLSFGSFFKLDTKKYPSLDIPFRSKSVPFCKKQFLHDAQKFIGTSYLWGGKSFPSKNPIGGVDCSGLNYMLFRAQGRIIPRDAHDQFLKSNPIKKEQLEPGDLLFWASQEHPERIKHTAIYKDKTHFIEAPGTGKKVRIQPLPIDFWEERPFYQFNDHKGSYHVHPRQFTKEFENHDEKKIRFM